jgi:hypothetical protein
MAKKKVQKGKQRGLKMNLWLKLFFMYKKTTQQTKWYVKN